MAAGTHQQLHWIPPSDMLLCDDVVVCVFTECALLIRQVRFSDVTDATAVTWSDVFRCLGAVVRDTVLPALPQPHVIAPTHAFGAVLSV